jgi:ABC-type polysaccharide/polyol phosphate export systems, permease component
VQILLKLFDVTLGPRLLLQHRTLVLHLLKRNIAARYRGSVLGLFWSFANPLLMLSVYTFVFGIVFKARWGQESFGNNPAAFPLLMFCGMAVFNIFSESVNTSPSLIVGNPSFVKKVIFPLEILPICNVITSLVFGLAWFALLFVGTAYFLGALSWTMLLLPLTLLPMIFIAMGVSLLLASLGVYLRDIQQLVNIATQILFFMTPIFYPIQVVPEKYRWVLQCNPLSVIVEQTRGLFLFGQVPDVKALLLIYIVALVVFQLGLVWFVKIKKGFADVL